MFSVASNVILYAGEIYTSEKYGSDESGDGTSEKPFKTILHAMQYHGQEPFPVIYVDGKSDDKVDLQKRIFSFTWVMCGVFRFLAILSCFSAI